MSITAPRIAGCIIEPLEMEDCERVLAWLLGEQTSAPPPATGVVWALAHSDGGVTWGRFDPGTSRWRLGHEAAPEVSPRICPEALQELRVFGEQCEILMWRTYQGLRGRVLRDSEVAADRPNEADPLRPSNESRIVRGDSVHSAEGQAFTGVTDHMGAQQVLPMAVTSDQLRRRQVRLHVRHYWVQDVEYGTVRIAVTRLVRLTMEGVDGR